MGKNKRKFQENDNSHVAKKPYSKSEPQTFFNQKKEPPSKAQETQEAQNEQEMEGSPQEITLKSTTEILLFGILQELKTRNMLEIAKLKAQQEQVQEELKAEEEMAEQDKAHFENDIRPSLYI